MKKLTEPTFCYDCGQEFDPGLSVGINWKELQYTPICDNCIYQYDAQNSRPESQL